MLLRLGELGEVYLFVALLRQRRDKVLEVFIAVCLQMCIRDSIKTSLRGSVCCLYYTRPGAIGQGNNFTFPA